MEASNAAAAAGGGLHNPIYISSDEDDERTPFDDFYSPDDVEIQEAILRSLDSTRVAITASASSPHTNVSAALETPPDCKGKCKLPSEGRCFTPIPNGPSNSKKRPSRRDHFECAICFERVQASEKFLVRHCDHAFCNTCVGRYVAAKIGENVAMIGCPDPECKKGSVEIDLCRGIIPSELFDRWNIALCEDIVGGDKFYCPFKDCSALLINDGAVEINETECPHCHRLFCASCRVPWHHGIKCKEFKKLGDDEKGQDDLALKKLADKKKWQRCPKCKMYVERTDGCVYMVCRCRHRFCYLCASPMTKGDHQCRKCSRTWGLCWLIDKFNLERNATAAIMDLCKVAWHDGVTCAEFQRLGNDDRCKDDLLLRKVAKNKKWQRRPKCQMYVERVNNCVYIVCRYRVSLLPVQTSFCNKHNSKASFGSLGQATQRVYPR
ncbi:hypothetical protein PR202_ga15836 [Eleusine coracana subsp. coracana]|uniref:RBR-type E3 ubiquitin transferase n=1 Tax=Eleusine coracana subsp. coracana TaxID=191504 RepID=A0AAV5CK34_ELECO|nr:hypothetical protein PR202_ga15836 [Eleusine coracana subsp. coracana]